MKNFKVDLPEGKQTVIYFNGCQITLYGQQNVTNEKLVLAFPNLFTEIVTEKEIEKNEVTVMEETKVEDFDLEIKVEAKEEVIEVKKPRKNAKVK